MFLCCGDALFDLFAEPGQSAGSIVLQGPVGGSPLNVANGLARLGNASGYLCKVSEDLFGERIREFLSNNGVLGDWVLSSDKNSTLAIVQTDEAGVPHYTFYTDNTADLSLTVDELPESLPEALAVIHVGSYSTAVDPTASSLQTLVDRERDRRVISYDPNIRPTIEPDVDVWRERFASLASAADVVKASDEDIGTLFGTSLGAEQFAADTLALGPALVLVTCGGDGAHAFTRSGEQTHVPGVDVQVVDTVGAGDTFQAASLHRLRADGALSGGELLIEQIDAERLLRVAVHAAALTCTRAGADLPDRATLEQFLSERS